MRFILLLRARDAGCPTLTFDRELMQPRSTAGAICDESREKQVQVLMRRDERRLG